MIKFLKYLNSLKMQFISLKKEVLEKKIGYNPDQLLNITITFK